VGGRNAWVEGVGEQLTPIRLAPAQFVVLKPPTGASTQAIFGSPRLKRDTKTATIQGFAADNAANATGSVLTCDLQTILDNTHNDLQPVASALCPEVTEGLSWLAEQGLAGRMTGSGTAVFAHLPHGKQVSNAPGGWVLQTCSNLDVHPLFDWCSD
jgi:4-diphosphocytidyl-2-C-methyl-D-erythritol kinase